MRSALILVLTLPMLVGCAAAGAPVASAAPEPSPSPSSSSAAVPEIGTRDASIGSAQTAAPVAPVRLTIPELNIDMRVDAMGLDGDGAMALPDNASDAGWYKFGPGVANDAGATVMAAHVDSRHDGIGPFSRLKDASPGSTISVAGSDGSTVDYLVTEVRSVGKIDAPMAEVFDRSGDPRLTLVTCGGEFDSSTGHYIDNIILTAIPAGT
ncbi:MAG: class F sortase [Microbacteriaceae bacterium]|nr:class F sortase [Microbacteriaceae bacterium]